MPAAAAAGPHPRIEEVVVEKSDFALTLSPKAVAHMYGNRLLPARLRTHRQEKLRFVEGCHLNLTERNCTEMQL